MSLSIDDEATRLQAVLDSTPEVTERSPPDVAPQHHRYTPQTLISHGPDGTAISAVTLDDHTPVELRLLAPARVRAHRWRTLRQHIAALDLCKHRHIRPIIEHDLDATEPLLVLAPAPGPTLAEYVAEHGAIDAFTVARWTAEIADALAEAHRLQLVHTALNPSSVWIDSQGAPWIELSTTNIHEPAAATGWTKSCLAPELRSYAPDSTSDVYALGIVAYGALLGQDPALAIDRTTGAGMVEGLFVILRNALQQDPDERPTAAQLAQMLLNWLRSNTAAQSTSHDVDESTKRQTLAAPVALKPGVQLGRYHLLRKLGEGAMGEVWEGMDLSTSASFALKALRPRVAADPVLLQRFRREARTLAAVRNPYIANMIELNEDQGVHYLIMEYVEGQSVGAVLKKIKIFEERDALCIIADACRALAEPHRTGVVHRDIKPDNLMFIRADEPIAKGDDGRQRVKLCDFGIARSQHADKDSKEPVISLTQEGIMVGTPAYMSPEQCHGEVRVSPASDVYSLGATLFQLLTGELLFTADTPMSLVVMHISEPPRKLSSVNAKISDRTSALVERALKKEPTERFHDASAMLEEIESILYGDAGAIEVHPRLPKARPGWNRKFVFEWELSATPEQLWPYVSNTERMNRAAGLAAVKYEIRGVSPGVSERMGSNSVLGFALKWQEMPYEWIENKRHSVLRVFNQGLLRWYSATVELERTANNKTLLRNSVTIEPSGWLAYLLSPFEMGVKYKRALNKVYRRLDGMLSAPANSLPPGIDKLQPDVKLVRGAESLLGQAMFGLAAAGVERTIAEQIIGYLRVASDQDVARIRPLEVADRLGLPGEAFAIACLHLAKMGVLVLLWDVLCPSCQIPSSLTDALQSVKGHSECATCNLKFSLDFGKSVEMIFRASPSIRAVETQTFCVGGPGHFPHVVAQLRLAPGERFVLPLKLAQGSYRIRSAQLTTARELVISPNATLRRLDLHVDSTALTLAGTTTLSTQDQLLVLSNGLPHELVLRVEREADRHFALTAAKASAMRPFRELFPEQVLAPGSLVTVAAMTLLCTDVLNSAAMLASLGDTDGTSAMLEQFRLINDVVALHGGALVKTVGTSCVVAFDKPSSAVAAAIELRAVIREKRAVGAANLVVAIHRGPMLAATLNDRLDYFGHHAELVLALPQQLSQPGTLLTHTVAGDQEVQEMLKSEWVKSVPRQVNCAGLSAWGIEISG